HIHSIIEEILDAGQNFSPVDVSPGSSSKGDCIDYVTVSLGGPYRAQPRADILDDVKQILNEYGSGIAANWQILDGPDKSRQASFTPRRGEDSQDLLEKLKETFQHRKLPFQMAWAGRDRVTFTFLSAGTDNDLEIDPPIINDRAYHPTVPNYVQPLYGLEVAVPNVKHFAQAHQMIDDHINRTYGEGSVVGSHLGFRNTIYCAVLHDPETTTRFLSDPFTVFNDESVPKEWFRPGKPDYLYNHNSN
ncbi:hypothetical protein H0H92_015585, partial [Tricholoma furcatifolium]